MAEFERIHAGMMNERDQQDFVYVAIGKVMGMLADQGIEPENVVAGLMHYVKKKAASTGTEKTN
jgi:hypothetical protein